MRGLLRRAAVAAVAYLGLLLVAADALGSVPVPGPFAGGRHPVSDRLGIPGERLMEPVWLCPDRLGREGAEMINAGQA